MNLTRIIEPLREHGLPAAFTGLALCFVVRDMPQFLSFQALNGAAMQYAVATGRGVALALALVVLALVHGRSSAKPLSVERIVRILSAFGLFAAVCETGGLAAVVFSEELPLQVAGFCTLGVGQSALVTAWTVWLVLQPRKRIFMTLASALALAGLLEVGLVALESRAELWLSLVVPLCSAALLALTARQTFLHPANEANPMKPAGDDTGASADAKASADSVLTLRQATSTDGEDGRDLAFDPATVCTVLAFVGYSFIARQLTDTWMLHGTVESLDVFQVAAGIGTAASALIVLSIFRLKRPFKNLGIYNAFVIPVLVAALYLSTFLTGIWSVAYVPPLFVLRKMILFLAIAGGLVYASRIDRLLFFCGAMMLNEFGSVIQTAFMEWLGPMGEMGQTVSSLVVFAVLVFIACVGLSGFFTAPSLPNDRTIAEPSAAELLERRRTQAIDELQESCGLTGREREVLAYLAIGRNAEHIARELVIAHSTAKSHIAHIYQKAGFNSQQQLMDDIDARIAEIEEAETHKR